ncbi:MAG: hypothetical protein KAT06_11920 [Gammaproteobacteria bacterium]|nr:hypothetical protein [Gammaproteobacteria bacterium]
MKIKIINKNSAVLAGLMLCISYPVQTIAVMKWQPAPMKHHKGMNHDRRAGKSFQLTEHNGAKVFFWKPNLKSTLLPLDNDQVKVKSTGMDNYHALVAKRRTEKLTEVAIRYPYMRGKPSGFSPKTLVGGVKASYEIMPSPLPREHRRYHAARDAVFVIRHEGQPIPKISVSLTTANGTTLNEISDRNGAVRFTLPDDFSETKPGRRNNKPAEFVVFSEYSSKGHQYKTTFSDKYHVDPRHWKSTELGTMVLAFGFISGVVITRRSRKNSNKTKGRKS